jgi:hypothetical protein
MQVVPVAGPSGLDVGAPKELFKMPTFTAVGGRYGGDRFLLAVPPDQSQTSRIGLIANWTAGLAK